MSKINIGDLVRSKTNPSQVMVVVKEDASKPDSLVCAWTSGVDECVATFSKFLLEPTVTESSVSGHGDMICS